MPLSDKIAVVTGASRGIGRAIAQRLARDGAFTVINYNRSFDQADSLVKQIESDGGSAVALRADVGSRMEIQAFYESLTKLLLERFQNPQFDILVNNAALSGGSSFENLSEEELDRVIAVNLKGPFFMIQTAMPLLREGGRVINISSGIARRPDPRGAAYAMSKAALNTLTLLAATELGKRSITVNTLVPGWTNTDINVSLLQHEPLRLSVVNDTAMGRVGEVEDIADAVSTLTAPDSRWITGQYIEVSGGYKMHI